MQQLSQQLTTICVSCGLIKERSQDDCYYCETCENKITNSEQQPQIYLQWINVLRNVCYDTPKGKMFQWNGCTAAYVDLQKNTKTILIEIYNKILEEYSLNKSELNTKGIFIVGRLPKSAPKKIFISEIEKYMCIGNMNK